MPGSPGRQAHSQLPGGVAECLIALLFGGHLLRHAPDYLLRSEGPTQHLLAGDAVEDRQNNGVRPHQVAAGVHGGVQPAEFYGEQQQIHRFLQLGSIGVAEITPCAVVPHAIPAIAVRPLPVGQHKNPVLAQGTGKLVSVQDAQGTQDAHGSNGFQNDPSSQ